MYDYANNCKAPNLVQSRLTSYRSIIIMGHQETFIFLAEFQYARFTQRLLTVQAKTAENIQSYLFEKQILQLKRA